MKTAACDHCGECYVPETPKTSNFCCLDCRFWAKVKVPEDKSECWEWKGSKSTDGSGRFSVKGVSLPAYRIAYKLSNGDIRAGQCVLHQCKRLSCVNPGHLFLGTHKDKYEHNDLREVRSKIDENDVVEIRKLWNEGALNQQEIAKRFEISTTQVWAVVHGKLWKHVP